MKKRATMLLIVPAAALLLSGCTVEGGLRKGKELAKEGVNKVVSFLDDYFTPTKAEEKPAEEKQEEETNVVVPEEESEEEE